MHLIQELRLKLLFLPFPRGGHLGKVNEYKAKNNDAPEAI